jgi:hypothetical protein
MLITISRANDKKKKYIATIENKNVRFGAFGMSDYTIHKDKERKKRYIARHKEKEDWTKAGIKTAGFWSRWLLWNKPSLETSARNIEKKFKVSIILKI